MSAIVARSSQRTSTSTSGAATVASAAVPGNANEPGGRCLIACSEGVNTPDGKTWLEKLGEDMGRDKHGNIQLSGTGA